MRFSLDLYGRGDEKCLSMDHSFPTLSDKIYILKDYDAASGSSCRGALQAARIFICTIGTSKSAKIDII